METVPLKRKQDNKQDEPDSKRTLIQFLVTDKVACLEAIVKAYERILRRVAVIVFQSSPSSYQSEEDAFSVLTKDIILAVQITNIMLACHNVNKQLSSGCSTSKITTDFSLCYKGVSISLPRCDIMTLWVETITEVNLEYKNFNTNDKNWYSTMNPYLNMFAAFHFRIYELRLGHTTIPVSLNTNIKVSNYGLGTNHNRLLVGSSFPSERKPSLFSSLGPITALLCLIKDRVNRKKYVAAVKKAMSHIKLPFLKNIIGNSEDIIDNSKHIVMLLAEILLLTTSRWESHMYFPINFLHYSYNKTPAHHRHQLLDYFNTTGAGGWYIYKNATDISWILQGKMSAVEGAQIVYHAIFGTFKENLSVLSQITDVQTWFNKKEISSMQVVTSGESVTINLPIHRYYPQILPKKSCESQTATEIHDYEFTPIVPCFSGFRIQRLPKKPFVTRMGNHQLQSELILMLEQLHKEIKDIAALDMRTTIWRDISSLSLNNPGDEVKVVISYEVESQ